MKNVRDFDVIVDGSGIVGPGPEEKTAKPTRVRKMRREEGAALRNVINFSHLTRRLSFIRW